MDYLLSPKLYRQAVDAQLIGWIDRKKTQIQGNKVLIDRIEGTILVRACGDKAKELGIKIGMPFEDIPKKLHSKLDIIDLQNDRAWRAQFPDVEMEIGNRFLNFVDKQIRQKVQSIRYIGRILWALLRLLLLPVKKLSEGYFGVNSLKELTRKVVHNAVHDLRGPLPHMIIHEVGNHFKLRVLRKEGELKANATPYLGKAILSFTNLALDWFEPIEPSPQAKRLWKRAKKVALWIANIGFVRQKIGAATTSAIEPAIEGLYRGRKPVDVAFDLMLHLFKNNDRVEPHLFGFERVDHKWDIMLHQAALIGLRALWKPPVKEAVIQKAEEKDSKERIRELRNIRGHLIKALRATRNNKAVWKAAFKCAGQNPRTIKDRRKWAECLVKKLEEAINGPQIPSPRSLWANQMVAGDTTHVRKMELADLPTLLEMNGEYFYNTLMQITSPAAG